MLSMALGWRPTAAGVELPFGGIFFESFENGDPNGGDAAGDGHPLVDHQSQDALRIDMRAGKHQTCTKPGGGKGQEVMHRASIANS